MTNVINKEKLIIPTKSILFKITKLVEVTKILFLETLAAVLSMEVNSRNNALLVIDVQNSFVEGGTLAVNGGRELVPLINQMMERYRSNFKKVVFSKDSHPPDHISFASQHVNKSVFDQTTLNYDKTGHLCQPTTLKEPKRANDCSADKQIIQTLWPDHCIQDSHGAQLVDELMVDANDVELKKGVDSNIDSYSAFYDVGRIFQTPLNDILSEDNIKTIFVVGIATDFCVKYTALDAKYLGYNVYVILDLTRGITEGSFNEAVEEMKQQDIKIIQSSNLIDIFKDTIGQKEVQEKVDL